MRRAEQKMADGMPGILRWGIPGLLVWACWVGVALGQNISTVAGNGNFGYSGDGGPATDASLADPAGIFVDGLGNLYIADTNNQRVRRVDTGGVITTVAGNGTAGDSGDGGAATDARLNFPTSVFVDGSGNLYIADRENHRVRRVDSEGTITTVAGNGVFGSGGDGAPATDASLAFPAGIFVDDSGNLYIADRFNYRVRRVDSGGTITTVAGNGSFGSSGDGGPATDASLAFPSGVFVNGTGELFIADKDNHRLRRVDVGGTITAFSGNGIPTFSGDGGAATDASLAFPAAVYGTVDGAIWVADTNNRRVRKIAAPLQETTAAAGLSGIQTVAPTQEVLVFTMGVTGDGTSSINAVTLTFSDLSSATGLTSNDFSELRLYQSGDAILDGGDTQIASLAQGNILIGSAITLTPGTPSVPPSGLEQFYLVSAVMNTQVTDGHVFRVGFTTGGLTTSNGGLGTAVSASDGNRVTLDVIATSLVFSVQPGGAVNGQALSVQPVVVAQDVQGNVDLGFDDVVTLAESAPGSLIGNTVSAVLGVATFTQLTFTATADQEAFVLIADDEPGGAEGDLTAITASSLVCDVVATELGLAVSPAGSVSGQTLATQPVVVARDASGLVDTGFGDVVTVSTTGAGTLSGNSVSAVSGVAPFTALTYTATADGESFTLAIDDESGGPEGDLALLGAGQLTSDVRASALVFTVQPGGSISGQTLSTQPVVMAQDGNGVTDVDFAETVTLTPGGGGSVTGASVAAVSGVATFSNLSYTATVDREQTTFVADDEPGGTEGNLPVGTSVAVESDVVATELVFQVQPVGSVSGQALVTQPVVAAHDASGLVDVDFGETVTLTTDGQGVLVNRTATAVSGVATFTQVVYTVQTSGETFRLIANDEAVGTDLPSVTSDVLASGVVATRLVFSVSPSGSVSGQALIVQPVVVAQDNQGAVDVNFSDTVTLTVSGPGGLMGQTAVASAGVATFSNLVYTATADGESFDLTADDENGGVEGDLPSANGGTLVSDVMATRLAFTVQPSGSVSGQVLSVQPVVEAHDDLGVRDKDFGEPVKLATTAPGTLANNTVIFSNGIGTFSNLIYTATTDSEPFVLTADDAVGGVELLPATSQAVTSDVVASRLVFTVQPSGSVSGQPLNIQPVVVARDAHGIVDENVTETVTLTAPGVLTNHILPLVNGVATFTDLTYTATSDGESFVLTADDGVGGVALASATSSVVSSDVVASQLVFTIQPSGSVSGQPLTTQPVVVARNSQGLTDVDFVDPVTLSSGGNGSLTGNTVFAINGIATFSGVVYLAQVDKAIVTLVADDVSNGGDLLPQSALPMASEVVASQLVFEVQPGGALSGRSLLTQPVVAAKDAQGVLDIDFSDRITLSTSASGTLTHTATTAQGGIATFSDVTYTTRVHLESFVIRADDTGGGMEGDLPPVWARPLTAGAGEAHHLALVFASDPIVADGATTRSVRIQVLDANDNLRLLDNSTVVTLDVAGVGAGGGTATVSGGEAVFVVETTTVPGSVALNVTAPGLVPASGSFATEPGPSSRLVLVYEQGALLANGLSLRTVKVQLLDANGNLRVNDNSSQVSLSVTGTGSGGGLGSVSKGEFFFVVIAGTTPGVMSLRANATGVQEVTGTLIVGALEPDLVILEPPTGPAAIFRGASYLVTLGVQNIGTGPTVGAFDVALFLVMEGDSIKMGETVVTQTIQPDSSLAIEVPFTVPSFSLTSQGKAFHWVVQVDAGGFLQETDETNNQAVGNTTGFPQLSVSETQLNFGSLLPDSTHSLRFDVINSGQAPLSVSFVLPDSQWTVEPEKIENLLPGNQWRVTVHLKASGAGPFRKLLQIVSNDPGGDIVVGLVGLVAVPERVFFDFDLEVGNQNLVLAEAGRNEALSLELYVADMPPVQALSVLLDFDEEYLTFVPNSWTAGTFIGDGIIIQEAELIVPGQVLVSVGTFGGSGGRGDGFFGALTFQTPNLLSDDQDGQEAVVRAVKMRFLRIDGEQDSLQILSEARIRLARDDVWPDLDGNGKVDFSDFLIFMGAFRQDQTSPGWAQELPTHPFPRTPYNRFDVDKDGRVGFFDFVTYAQDYRKANEGEAQESERGNTDSP